MAKKKKTQLKPLVRGFATTSMPKKITEPANSGPEVQDKEKFEPEMDSSSRNQANTSSTLSTTVEKPDLNVVPALAPRTEDQVWQALVDKLQDKVEKDITRCDILVFSTLSISFVGPLSGP
jgi:ATP-dependent RNA helicase DHX29